MKEGKYIVRTYVQVHVHVISLFDVVNSAHYKRTV
jgi:hypothetical protein